MEIQRNMAKIMLKKKNKAEGKKLPDFMTYMTYFMTYHVATVATD